jgi:tetratricopeptide (TPR) repeat protein
MRASMIGWCALFACLLIASVSARAETAAGPAHAPASASPTTLASAEAFSRANPRNADGWVALARARLIAGKAEPAIAAAQKATQLAPGNAQAFFLLGNAYGMRIGQVGMLSKMGIAPKLRDAFERTVQLDPGQLEARGDLISYYLQAPSMLGGGIEKARAQAVEIGKRDAAQGLLARAGIARFEHKTDLALSLYRNALGAKPHDRDIRLAVVMGYGQMERWPEAFDLLHAWTVEDPSAGAAWYQIGRASALSGLHANEGIAALQRYLAMPHAADDVDTKHALYRLGQIQAKAGRKADARASWQQALKLDPGFTEARDALSAS